MAVKKTKVEKKYLLVVAACDNDPEVIIDDGDGIMDDIESYASDKMIQVTEVGVYELGTQKQLTLSFKD